jgi:hypothetical protein
VRQQDIVQLAERGQHRGPAGGGTAVLRRGLLESRHRRADRMVVGVHRVQHRRGGRAAAADQRVQAGVLGLVVPVQELHQPAQVRGDSRPLAVGRGRPSWNKTCFNTSLF